MGVFSDRKPCLCHKLHNFEENLFSDSNLKALFPELETIISENKSFVRYVKKSGINAKLPTTLKQSVPTRWDSNFIMLESYLKVKFAYM